MSQEKGLDGGQAVGRVGAEFRDAWISSLITLERARRNVEEVARHLARPAPTTVQQQDALVGVGRREDRPLGGQADVAVQRRPLRQRPAQEDQPRPAAQRQHRALAWVLVQVADNEGRWKPLRHPFSLLRLLAVPAEAADLVGLRRRRLLLAAKDL